VPKTIAPEKFYGEVDDEWRRILEHLQKPFDYAECATHFCPFC